MLSMQISKVSKYIKETATFGLLASLVLLQGCVKMILPTSESELISKSIGKGGSIDVPLGYVDAYANLKQAYLRCEQVKTANSYVLVDANLDREKNLAIFFGKAPYGTYLFKTTITPSDANNSNLTLHLMKAQLLTEKANQNLLQKRLERDRLRALGQDTKCNKD